MNRYPRSPYYGRGEEVESKDDIRTHNIRIYMGDIVRHCMQKYIENTYWSRYIVLGPASEISTEILTYVNPCQNFWNLRETNKNIFKRLGIKVKKRDDELWEAYIPINCLTDKVFFESGLINSHRS